MAELNIIEKANKVMSFRKMIRAICQKKGLEYPSDDKIAEYITKGYGMDVDEFMTAYEGKVGIFKDPFDDFKAELEKITWGDNPTEAEMRKFFNENGNDVHGFIREHSIKSYHGLAKETLLATLKLSDATLVLLWNVFIEESAKYGEDSYIYDLGYKADVEFINNNFPKDKIAELTRIVRNEKLHNKEVQFFQWYNLNDNKIHVKRDIKGIIVAYWDEIFERIMIFPSCYDDFGGFKYFTEVFWEACMKHMGYTYNEREAKLSVVGA